MKRVEKVLFPILINQRVSSHEEKSVFIQFENGIVSETIDNNTNTFTPDAMQLAYLNQHGFTYENLLYVKWNMQTIDNSLEVAKSRNGVKGCTNEDFIKSQKAIRRIAMLRRLGRLRPSSSQATS